MADIKQLLRAVPLFEKLEPHEYAQLEELVEIIGVLRGTELFKKGDPTDSFYVVARGRVEIVIDEDTRIPLEDGEFFGEMGVLNSAPRNATAVAGDDSILLRIMKRDFDRVLSMDDAIASKVMSVCLDRGRAFAVNAHGDGDRGEVAVFYSPRGGAGTTSLAVNTACRVAALTGETVAILDGDLQFGNCHVLLDATGSQSLAERTSGRPGALTDEEMAELVIETDKGVALVRAPARTEEADTVQPVHLVGLVDYLRRRFGRVVVDTPSALNDRTLALIDAASMVFMVAEPEIVSLHRVVDCFRLFDLAGFSREGFKLVLNKVGKGGFPVEAVEQKLAREVYAAVGRDRKVAEAAIFEGKTVMEIAKDSPMSVGVAALARRWVNPLASGVEANPEQEKKAGFSFWGLFGGGDEVEPAPRH